MTEIERKLSALLAGCSFIPGHWHKRFATNIHNYEGDLSARQRWYLHYLVHRYRKQTGKKAGAISAAFLRMHPTAPEKEKKQKPAPPQIQSQPKTDINGNRQLNIEF